MWHRAGHVGDAVVDDAIDHEAGIGVRGGPGCLNAAALVDGYVDDDGALLHLRDHGAGDELGRGGAGNEHTADDEVCFAGSAGQVVAVGGERVEAAAKDVVELAEAVEVYVDERDTWRRSRERFWLRWCRRRRRR